MNQKKFSNSSPEVVAILDGAFKHGAKGYYRLTPEGKCEIYGIRSRLMALGIGSTTATQILERADIPTGEFIKNRVAKAKRLITTVKADVEEYPKPTEVLSVAEVVGMEEEETASKGTCELLTPSADKPEKEVKSPKKTVPPKMTEEEREAKFLKAEEAANSKRYQYITTSSGKHGIYEGREATVVSLYYTKGEALVAMDELRHGREAFRIYFATPGNRKNRLQEPINYND
jgi:hypothetical protein